MSLSAIELRILGCLLEKERTTPDQYPLTTHSLVLACNQKTNRDPVTEYIEYEIEQTLSNLRDKGLIRSTRADHERVFKHSHRLQESFQLNAKGLAILAVLILRGKQTPGELRTRTDRYVQFHDLNEVEDTLERLESYQPPLVKNYGRGPGQSQDRWWHTLGSDEERQRPRVRSTLEQGSSSQPLTSPIQMASALAPSHQDFEALKHELEDVKAKLKALYENLGLSYN